MDALLDERESEEGQLVWVSQCAAATPNTLRHSEHAHPLSDIEKLTLPIFGHYVPFLEPNRRFGLSVGTHQ